MAITTCNLKALGEEKWDWKHMHSFSGSCRWGKHQCKNRLFLGPQHLRSVNASESYFIKTTHLATVGLKLHPAGVGGGKD